MKRISKKVVAIVVGFFVWMMGDVFTMNPLDAANLLKIMGQWEQSKQTEKWRLEIDSVKNERSIIKCQSEISSFVRLRGIVVPALYRYIQHPKLAELLPSDAGLSVSQQESLIMFVSQMDSDGNIKIADPYLVAAPINILGVESKKNAISGYILGKMIERIPAEFLEGSDFYPDQGCGCE